MKKYRQIWELALPYLEKGINKNFIVHTEGVVKAMQLILKKEKGDPDILIPAAMLHDVGWAQVEKNTSALKIKQTNCTACNFILNWHQKLSKRFFIR